MRQGFEDDDLDTLDNPVAGDAGPPTPEWTGGVAAGNLCGRLYAATDVGRSREQNEDFYLVDAALSLIVVADGMGGHERGEVASRMAATGIAEQLRGHGGAPLDPGAAEDRVVQAVRAVNRQIYVRNMARGYEAGRGMGTTVVGLWCYGGHDAVAFHVGDSRLYHYRRDALHAGTTDHTLYESWKASGKQGDPPKRNILMRAVGVFEEVEVETARCRLEAGDVTLLCSDGLTRMLNDNAIHRAVTEIAARGPEAVGRDLLRTANERGGRDNITLAVALWE